MTASAASATLRAGLLGAVLCAGCAGVTPTPVEPMEPLPRLGATAPRPADLAARDLAARVLSPRSRSEDLDAALAALGSVEAERLAADEAPSGLVPYALDALHATGDPGERRDGARALLARRDLDPALRERLERELADDPLLLARERIGDARTERLGRRVNAVVEPIGRSITNVALLPVRLLPALVGLAVAEHGAPELSGAERQALDHWKTYIERNPGDPEAAALLERVERSQRRWYRTQRDRWVRGARRALRADDPGLAVALAERALRYAPEDRDAAALLAEAEERATWSRRERARSTTASAEASLGGRALAEALLAADGAITAEAERLLAAEPRGPLADEARFALALAEAEAGGERRAWKALDDLADASDRRSNMARHARALHRSPERNPHRAWKRARSAARSERVRWLFLGPLAGGARQRDLPRPVEWLVEIPSLPGVVLGLPNRLIRFPFVRTQRRSPGVFARRYLERHPEGEHAAELRDWLVGYEAGRGNALGAVRLAEADPGISPRRLARLREDAASQLRTAAEGERRLDRRVALLRRVASEFPLTRAGSEAGEALRETVRTASAQRIRISRGFLEENPAVAGPEGLALRPELLDGELDNGELHPEGVTLLGDREIELAFVAPSGRERDEPERLRQRVSAERLARAVALLDETSQRNALLDRDQPFAPDADRDLFFERARFGLDDPGPRVTARSTFVYEGARERYGLVRGRESILPVDLVLQGSLSDFGLGAFPRVRMPKKTPDAFLYR